ncbi:MAG: hypothetical protein P1V51_00680 [Deltaproteobacteria bacterium]|nr:hypothetical protein [Deltaproteobacteria bacterium]
MRRALHLLTLVGLLGATQARAEDGLLGWGLRVELGVGPVEAVGPGGAAVGVVQHLGFQLGLAPAWALRLEGSLSRGIEEGKASWAQAAVAVVGMYRFLDDRAPLRPALGAGLRIGALVASRELLGLPASTDPNDRSSAGFPVSPLLAGSLEWRIGKALGLLLVIDGAWVSFPEGAVWHLSERLVLALRF